MPKITVLIVSIVLQASLLAAQYPDSAAIGYYHNGEIVSDWKNTKRHKHFEGKTVLLQEKYETGRLSKEYFRYNDTLFLYTEYYEFPDSSVKYPHEKWGVKKEGLVSVSKQTTGDTIVTFDPETYEEFLHMDTLLLPVGPWTFYYHNGQISVQGNYEQYQQQGIWTYFNPFGEINQKRVYHKGAIAETIHENVLETDSEALIAACLQNTWIIHDLSIHGTYVPNPQLESYRFLYPSNGISGIGDIYDFQKHNVLAYTKTNLVNTLAEGLLITQEFDITKSLTGQWKLVNLKQLEILLDGQKELFDIEYLSKNYLCLKKAR